MILNIDQGGSVNPQCHATGMQTALAELDRMLARTPYYSSLHFHGAQEQDKAAPTKCKRSIASTLWAAIKKFVHAKAGAAHTKAWEDSAARYLASRNKEDFLTLLAYKLLKTHCHCVVHQSKALMLFPPGTDIKPLLADKGQIQKQLAQLAGMERLAIIRRPQASEPKTRLARAIKSLTKLKYGADFQIDVGHPELVPIIYVRQHAASKFIGAGGSNLHFIETAAGLKFDFVVTRVRDSDIANREAAA